MAGASTHSVTGISEEQLLLIARALADPRRFAILQQIAAADTMACCNLREQDLISPATISHHLKELSDAGLISITRDGRLARLTLCRSVLQAYIARLSSL